jgi:hypothetical protein
MHQVVTTFQRAGKNKRQSLYRTNVEFRAAITDAFAYLTP